MKDLTKEQIAELKKKYGEIYQFKVDDKKCILHKPSRQVLSAATVTAGKDPIKFNEIILKNCWIQGDEEIQTDDNLFLGICPKLAEIIEVKEAEIKKL